MTTAGLTVIWCGLWGSVSIANVVSGLALSVVVLNASRNAGGGGVIHVWPLLRFAWLVGIDLARSTFDVAVAILTPTDRTEEAIVAVDLPATGSEHLLLLSASITLSPGTAVVDVDAETGRYYIHLLHASKRETTVAHALRLGELACKALPTANPMGAR